MLRISLVLSAGMSMGLMAGCAQIIGIEDLPEVAGGGTQVVDAREPADAPAEAPDAREGCGNGVQEFGEACDDGVETARCNADCSLAECGDGKLNPTAGEQCDDDNVQPNDGCDATCQLECGNSRVDDGEICDEGESTATCDADCTVPECGDGFYNSVFPGDNPQAPVLGCDDGGNSDTCNANCTVVAEGNACGDEHVNPALGELCDGGGTALTCDDDCTLPRCGDGLPNPAFGEACDDGGINTSGCDYDCTAPLCGDGIVNTAASEECDDGNGNDNDDCPNDCRIAICAAPGDDDCCGDGFRDRFEQCDDDNGNNGDACRDDCTFGPTVILNNGIREGEECEPALDGANACDPDGTRTVCGDGFIKSPTEECDDGNTSNGDGCSSTCRFESNACGDGTKERLEQCDDGNRNSGDGCSADCRNECGNGALNAFEQCDNGDREDGDGCSADCRFETCGNGARDPGEPCDPTAPGDVCDPDCSLPQCGDGIVNEQVEACDDGNTSSGDGCSADCLLVELL